VTLPRRLGDPGGSIPTSAPGLANTATTAARTRSRSCASTTVLFPGGTLIYLAAPASRPAPHAPAGATSSAWRSPGRELGFLLPHRRRTHTGRPAPRLLLIGPRLGFLAIPTGCVRPRVCWSLSMVRRIPFTTTVPPRARMLRSVPMASSRCVSVSRGASGASLDQSGHPVASSSRSSAAWRELAPSTWSGPSGGCVRYLRRRGISLPPARSRLRCQPRPAIPSVRRRSAPRPLLAEMDQEGIRMSPSNSDGRTVIQPRRAARLLADGRFALVEAARLHPPSSSGSYLHGERAAGCRRRPCTSRRVGPASAAEERAARAG